MDRTEKKLYGAPTTDVLELGHVCAACTSANVQETAREDYVYEIW